MEWKKFWKREAPDLDAKIKDPSGILRIEPSGFTNIGGETATHMEAHKLVVDYIDIQPHDTEIVPIDLTPDTEVSLRDYVDKTQQYEEYDGLVDCYTFGVLASGGEIHPRAYEEDIADRVEYNYKLGPKEKVDEIDENSLPSWRPLGIGVPGSGPDHVIVKLSEVDLDGNPIYVSKLGLGNVVVTDLPSITEYYGATHIAPFEQITVTREDGQHILNYNEPLE